MRCDECGYRHWTADWDPYWQAVLCDYCVEWLDYLEWKRYFPYYWI